MKNNLKAFSLIEALLGLTIFSIIALSIYSAFSSGMLLNRRSDDTNTIFREARWSLDRISSDLENMRPFDFSNSDGQKAAFTGTSDSVSFIAATDNGLMKISYSLKSPEYGSVFKTIIGQRQSKNTAVVSFFEEKSDIRLLTRQETPFADSLQPEVQAKPDHDVLSINVQKDSLKFLYAYVEGQGENARIVWKDSWGQAFSPLLVRIAITFVPSDKTKTPLTLQKDVYIPTGILGAAG